MLRDLGNVIRFHRKKSGLTQLELATLAGIGKAAVYEQLKMCSRKPMG